MATDKLRMAFSEATLTSDEAPDMYVIQATVLAGLTLVSASAFAQVRSLSLGSQTYSHAFSAEQQNASLHEFVKPGEKLDNWTSLLTVQCHPEASLVGDVLDPYLKNRKSFLLAAPQFLKSPNDGSNGVIVVAAMGEKGAKIFEFVVSRFVQSPDFGVLVVALTTKHRVSKEVRIDQKETQNALENFDLTYAKGLCANSSG